MVPNLASCKRPASRSRPSWRTKIAQTRADYDRWLDARYAAARGHLDALIDPLATRRVLDLAFDVACAAPFTEHLPIQLTTLRGVTFVDPDPVACDGHGAVAGMIRIANGQGFWGDWLEAPVNLVGARAARLPHARLSGRSDHVDSAEAAQGRRPARAMRGTSRR